MVRRACFRASSGTKNRGATPRELSTVPTAAAARIVFHRPGDAEAEESTVKQLASGASKRGKVIEPLVGRENSCRDPDRRGNNNIGLASGRRVGKAQKKLQRWREKDC